MRKSILFFMMAAAGLTATAAPITPGEALARLERGGLSKRVSKFKKGGSLRLAHSMQRRNGEAALYVFNNGNGNGYVVLSADDKVTPVLGYAETGSFDVSNIPPQLQWWLDEYSGQITLMSENEGNEDISGAPGEGEPGADGDAGGEARKAVSPILKTKWNQGMPFNNLCPEYALGTNYRCATGCVATAMAQVMKHYSYPLKATGEVSVTSPLGGTLTMDLSAEPFDWAKMKDVYNAGEYTKEEGNAVALLMKACGYSVDMNYGPSSGASSFAAAVALVNNFGYNSNIRYLSREYFSTSEWDAMLYGEMVAGRPVLYGGSSSSGGHEFVCDGYDGNGYYHFNWGWSGMSDGWFIIDALNPDDVGIGGGDGGGYNKGHDMIIGIQPEATEADVMTLFQNQTLIVSITAIGEKKVALKPVYLNMSLNPFNGDFGVRIDKIGADGNPVEDASTYQVLRSNITIPAAKVNGTRISYMGIPTGEVVDLTEFADGSYRLTVMTKEAREGAGWIPVRTATGTNNYVTVTILNGELTDFEFTDLRRELQMEDMKLLSSLYYGMPFRVQLTVKNDTDEELSRVFYPSLKINSEGDVLSGEGVKLTVQPHSVLVHEFTTDLVWSEIGHVPTADEQATLHFDDNERGLGFGGIHVTLKVYNGDPVSPKALSLTLRGAEKTEEEGGKILHTVANREDIPFEGKVSNESGYFTKRIYVVVCDPSDEMRVVGYAPMGPTPTLDPGKECEVSCRYSFPEAENEKEYAAHLGYLDNNTINRLTETPTYFRVVSPEDEDPDISTSVKEVDKVEGLKISFDRAAMEVSAESEAGITMLWVVSPDGRIVDVARGRADRMTLSVAGMAEGVAIVLATDGRGHTSTAKIVK